MRMSKVDWGTNSSRYTGRKSETAFDF